MNIKSKILIEFIFHDTYLTRGAYKILISRMEGIQSWAQKPSRFYREGFFVLGACKAALPGGQNEKTRTLKVTKIMSLAALKSCYYN